MMYNIENKTHNQIVSELTEWFDKKKLTITIQLRDWLKLGFPEELKEIDLKKLSKKK